MISSSSRSTFIVCFIESGGASRSKADISNSLEVVFEEEVAARLALVLDAEVFAVRPDTAGPSVWSKVLLL